MPQANKLSVPAGSILTAAVSIVLALIAGFGLSQRYFERVDTNRELITSTLDRLRVVESAIAHGILDVAEKEIGNLREEVDALEQRMAVIGYRHDLKSNAEPP